MSQLAKKMRVVEGSISPQFSAERGKEDYTRVRCEGIEKKLIATKKIPRRQEQIRQNIKEKRAFRERQKESGAENYRKIWER